MRGWQNGYASAWAKETRRMWRSQDRCSDFMARMGGGRLEQRAFPRSLEISTA